ncbi:hypothetical protein D3C84_507950 [compost metagenome]
MTQLHNTGFQHHPVVVIEGIGIEIIYLRNNAMIRMRLPQCVIEGQYRSVAKQRLIVEQGIDRGQTNLETIRLREAFLTLPLLHPQGLVQQRGCQADESTERVIIESHRSILVFSR